MRRRLRHTTLVLVSQMLLIALALTWLIQLSLIAASGSIYFIEKNDFILYAEIFLTLFIVMYAVCIVISQIRKLGERRGTDRRAGDRGSQ
jgi:membrane protein YdbS with pleckstrin-like domain